MSQIEAIKNFVKTSESLKKEDLSFLPQTHLEVLLNISFKEKKLTIFNQVLDVLKIHDTQIKSKDSIIYYLLKNNARNFSFEDFFSNPITVERINKNDKPSAEEVLSFYPNAFIQDVLSISQPLNINDFQKIFSSDLLSKNPKIFLKNLKSINNFYVLSGKEIPYKFFLNYTSFILHKIFNIKNNLEKKTKMSESEREINEELLKCNNQFMILLGSQPDFFKHMTRSNFINTFFQSAQFLRISFIVDKDLKDFYTKELNDLYSLMHAEVLGNKIENFNKEKIDKIVKTKI